MSVDYFYARIEQKFVQAQKKTPQSFDYGVYMVARGGIEPPTQGFSIVRLTRLHFRFQRVTPWRENFVYTLFGGALGTRTKYFVVSNDSGAAFNSQSFSMK